jgi:DEAD/DEAH box helicase domain-containing protein
MDITEFIETLKEDDELGKLLSHLEIIPERDPKYREPASKLPKDLKNCLTGMGIKSLYTHQAEAVDKIEKGLNVVISTETASGKSLAYNIPVLKKILEDPKATAIYLFPLKALEQDQLKTLEEMLESLKIDKSKAAIYDGDTSQHKREKIRTNLPNILITNPDMIHLSILPFYKNWETFFKNLKYIVIDELHTYRGVFGSHIAQILKRFFRILDFYNCKPQVIACSATINNPQEFSEKLVGKPFEVVSENGAPRGRRHFVFMNSTSLSAYLVSSIIFRMAIKSGLKTIAFTKARKITELLHSWVIQADRKLETRISSYRAGFLPEERRDIEKRLFSGELDGVISTSALEMGVDIGELDVCILVGYPGTIINTWQRGGRVGRSIKDSAIFMVAQADALDQYFIRHPNDFFIRNYEAAVVDPENDDIKSAHLVCAAAEFPLRKDDQYFAGENTEKLLSVLENKGEILLAAKGGEYFSNRKRPQRFVNIREAGESFTIFEAGTKNVIGSVSGSRAFGECHDGAIYLHRAKQYIVRKLDLDKKNIYAEACEVKYYTQAKSDKDTEVLAVWQSKPVNNFIIRLGRVKVTTQVTGYEKRKIFGQDLLSHHPLDLPKTTFETVGFWVEIDDFIKDHVTGEGLDFMGGIHAMEHAAISMFPLHALCDRDDVGGISYPMHPQIGKSAVFIYDGYPGGVGLAKRGYEVIENLLSATYNLIKECECEDGCPSCIHSPKCGSGNKPLDKRSALIVLGGMLGKIPIARKKGADPEIALPVEALPGIASGLEKPKKRIIIFDIETQRSAGEVGGWENSHLMRVACIVAHDSLDEKYKIFYENNITEFLDLVKKADLVVGFNSEHFDFNVLRGYTDFNFSKVKSFDIMKEVAKRLGYRLGLDHLAKHTLNKGKTADGLQSLEWFKNGELDKVVSYCKDDVELTKELFEFGLKNQYLLFERKDGNVVRIPLEWDLDKIWMR